MWHICHVYMVKAMIDIKPKVNQVLNIVKAQHGLKTKSEAINFVVREYEIHFMEPEFRPEFKKKLQKIMRGKYLSQKEFEKVINSV